MTELDDATVEAIAAAIANSECAENGRYYRNLARTLAPIFAKHLPDPRPTEAEALRIYGHVPNDAGWSRLRDLGCFRPEPADEGAFSWPVTIRPDPEGWEPVDG